MIIERQQLAVQLQKKQKQQEEDHEHIGEYSSQ